MREVITADQANTATIEPPVDEKPEKRGPGRPPNKPKEDEPKSVKFRINNIGRVNFSDGTFFDFNRPIMEVSNPDIIKKLSELANRATTIHIYDPENL